MTLKTAQVIEQLAKPGIKLGDVRAMAKDIKKDHALAFALWPGTALFPKLLALLIMDAKQLDARGIDELIADIEGYPREERLQLLDWLMANLLRKDKKLTMLMQSWQHHESALHRRLFWYHQARLRWTGQTPPENTEALLEAIETQILTEDPDVQWAMNFTAAWIGIFEEKYRERCIGIGQKTGLYKDQVVPKNCHPDYLPEFIKLEVAKRKL